MSDFVKMTSRDNLVSTLRRSVHLGVEYISEVMYSIYKTIVVQYIVFITFNIIYYFIYYILYKYNMLYLYYIIL